jgi:hypothetical protein
VDDDDGRPLLVLSRQAPSPEVAHAKATRALDLDDDALVRTAPRVGPNPTLQP